MTVNDRSVTLQIVLTPAELAVIDELRGDVPRSTWAKKRLFKTISTEKE